MELTNFLSFSFLISALRVSVPLVFAAQAGLLSERSGVVQIALEGFMLVGAFSGAVFGFHFNSALVGFLFAFLFGSAFSLLFSLFTIKFKSDQIVIGTRLQFTDCWIDPFHQQISL
jgi:ABC-type uncharacterized transport system permease subunit